MENSLKPNYDSTSPSYIERTMDYSRIVSDFCSSCPRSRIYVCAGASDSGSPAVMQEIINQLSKMDDWAAVPLTPALDLLESLVCELSQIAELDEIFRQAKIDLSVLGLGPAVEGAAPLFTCRTAAYRILEALTKAGKKVLILMNGIDPAENLQVFIHEFQIYAGDQLNVFLIMAGSLKDLNRLKNQRNLTFLYRAPRVEMTSRIPE